MVWKVPPEPLGLNLHKDALPGLKAFNSLKIEDDAGMTYIVMPKGVTWRMLSDLLAQALGKPTCFTYMNRTFPATYWDIPVETAYAFFITNYVIENSRMPSRQKRIELLGQNGCEVIDGFEQLALLSLTYIVSQEQSTSGMGVRLYNDDQSTYTCVRINNLFFEFGGFSRDGLHIPRRQYDGEVLGAGALRRLGPL